jgi:hypothetical protein
MSRWWSIRRTAFHLNNNASSLLAISWLDDDRTLRDYDIRKVHTLNVMLCLCGCWARDAMHGYSTMSSILLYSSFFTVVVGELWLYCWTLVLLCFFFSTSSTAVLSVKLSLLQCINVNVWNLISRINQILVECILWKTLVECFISSSF